MLCTVPGAIWSTAFARPNRGQGLLQDFVPVGDGSVTVGRVRRIPTLVGQVLGWAGPAGSRDWAALRARAAVWWPARARSAPTPVGRRTRHDEVAAIRSVAARRWRRQAVAPTRGRVPCRAARLRCAANLQVNVEVLRLIRAVVIGTVAAALARARASFGAAAAPAGLEPVPPAGMPKDGAWADCRSCAGTVVIESSFGLARRE
jgi:hypothetical protein